MRCRRLIAFVLAGALSIPTQAAVAFDGPRALTPAQVVEIDRELDGTLVTVEGEAIGEHLRAVGGGRWVNLLGDDVGLGVWMTDQMVERITTYGDYKHTGDIVRVTGRLNIACAEHGGEFDVHAASVEIVQAGGPRTHEPRPIRGVIGLAGVTGAFALWRAFLRRREDPAPNLRRG